MSIVSWGYAFYFATHYGKALSNEEIRFNGKYVIVAQLYDYKRIAMRCGINLLALQETPS